MAKPGGAKCDLRCSYCYYLSKEGLTSGGSFFMTNELLERYIIERISCAGSGPVHFEWHGGEPTILGLEYFRNIVRLQKKHLPEGKTLTNGLQTNGIHIDDDWADFLYEESFSTGISLDGPADLHDMYRKTRGGGPTHSIVENAFRRLKKRGVFCNILCVLHKGNVKDPCRVYDYFRELNASYIQFLPLVERPGAGNSGAAARPEEIGSFLSSVFDMWITHDVGRIVIQTFDEALRPVYGIEHALCVHRKTCGDVPVLTHDGSFYACDHFVDNEHLIGNIKTRTLRDLAGDPKMREFGNSKYDSLPGDCLECSVLTSCYGGCLKDRFCLASDGQPGKSYLCPAYKMFFTHSLPALMRLAAHMKAGLRLRSFHYG
jgi:uncharacterized protein